MDVSAHLSTLRIATRKVRLVAGLLKGRDALAAKHQLRAVTKRSVHPIAKLIDSAMANAQNNYGMVKENLKIKDVIVDGGPILKRFRPKGFGSTSPIEKRTSHITVILTEKIAGMKAQKQSEQKKEAHTHGAEHRISGSSVKDASDKPEVKKEIGKKDSGIKAFGRKFFRRKTV